MIVRRANPLAQADHHHFQKPAAERVAAEIGVRLDAVHHHDAIRAPRLRAEENIQPFGRGADPLNIHRGVDRHIEVLLGEAVLGQDLLLTLRRRAAVTAHRRHKKRLRAGAPEDVQDRRDDALEIADAAAANRDGKTRPGFDTASKRVELRF